MDVNSNSIHVGIVGTGKSSVLNTEIIRNAEMRAEIKDCIYRVIMLSSLISIEIERFEDAVKVMITTRDETLCDDEARLEEIRENIRKVTKYEVILEVTYEPEEDIVAATLFPFEDMAFKTYEYRIAPPEAPSIKPFLDLGRTSKNNFDIPTSKKNFYNQQRYRNNNVVANMRRQFCYK